MTADLPAGLFGPGASLGQAYADATAANPDALTDEAKNREEEAYLADRFLREDIDRVTVAAPRTEEWHVTVEGSPIDWYDLCTNVGVTPLYLELPDHRLQLLATLDADPRVAYTDGTNGTGVSFLDYVTARGFTVVRIKHEVSALLPGETALYHEAHATYDGVFRPDRRNASRDLYRAYATGGARWYLTWRWVGNPAHVLPDPRPLAKGSTLVKVEREVVLLDTNPGLDENWL